MALSCEAPKSSGCKYTGTLLSLAVFPRDVASESAYSSFAIRGGTPLDRGNFVVRKLHPQLESLGIKRYGMHSFRHTNGRLMDQLNAPMKIRQKRLGHALGSDITMAVYTHVLAKGDRRVAQQLGDIFAPKCAQIIALRKHGIRTGYYSIG
jgi:integrase